MTENALSANALSANALSANALSANALSANALSANALSANSLTSITAPDAVGLLSRQLLKYTVGCALSTTQSFSFSWTDGGNVVHNETYAGVLGLAPAWASGPLDLVGAEDGLGLPRGEDQLLRDYGHLLREVPNRAAEEQSDDGRGH